MSHAWFYYLFPLGLSSCFMLFAGVRVREVVRGQRNEKGEQAKPSDAVFPVLFGSIGATLALAILLTSPTPWQRERLFNRVFHTPPEQIERFVLLPGADNQYQPLNSTRIVIDDPQRVKKIAEALARSTETFSNRPQSRWTVKVEMVTAHGSYYFGVSAPAPGDGNGTQVHVHRTKASWGWYLGDFRADGLDLLLEEAIVARD
ncbi:MAG: hypothetical protein AAF612_04150 [Planctomycetota bacterium]